MTAREIEWNGWRAFELDNGTVRAVVVPQIARVMHYGFSDGGEAGNVLWTNPDVAGDAPNGAWTNFGGDKVWPWPQPDPDGWPTHFGGDWPPPQPFEGVAWTGRLERDAVVLEGPAADVYNVRPTRTIRLDPTGSGLTVTSTFAPTGDRGEPAGVWHVTQIPRDNSTIVALPGNAPADARWMLPNEANRLADVATELEGDAIALAPIGSSAKVGLDVPRLAAGIAGRGRDAVLVQRIVAATGDAYREANDRAQVWMLGTDGGDANPWAELEFTAPIGRASSPGGPLGTAAGRRPRRHRPRRRCRPRGEGRGVELRLAVGVPPVLERLIEQLAARSSAFALERRARRGYGPTMAKPLSTSSDLVRDAEYDEESQTLRATIEGEINLHNSPALRTDLLALAQERRSPRSRCWSSAACRTWTAAPSRCSSSCSRACAGHKGVVRLHELQPRVKGLLQIARLDSIFDLKTAEPAE